MKRRRASALLGMGLAALLAPGCLLRQQKPDCPVDRPTPAESAGDGSPPMQSCWPAPPGPPSTDLPPPAPAETGPALLPVAELKQTSARATPAVRSAAPPEEPSAPDPPLVAALRCAMQKQPQRARAQLRRYGPADRELLLALLRLTAGVGADGWAKLSPAEQAAALGQLEAVAAGLRGPTPLRIERVSFCRRIDGFGQFDPLPASHEFQPGSEGQPGDLVQVYVELRNFSSRAVGGEYEMKLARSAEVFDLHRRKVASLDLGSDVDRCRARRQDYFLNLQFHVPARLPAGLYTVRVTVHDQTPGPDASSPARVASRTLDLRVGATPPVVAPRP